MNKYLTDDSKLLLEIKNLSVSLPLDEGTVQAVEDVSLIVRPGEVLGLAGESGCGKTVTAQSILRIVPTPGRIDGGEILYYHSGREEKEGPIDLVKLRATGKEMRDIRGNEITMIFQEPLSSFSPLYRIGNQIMEAFLLHQDVTVKEARKHVIEMLSRVGIPDAEHRIDDYPFEFSGGMRQRAMIAMALCCHPSLLIADEPTTALDVTIQAQILRLMKDLREEFGMAIIFITHNLGVIAQVADRIAIMYLGKIVEEGLVKEIFHAPKHPYTFNLLQSIPHIGKPPDERLVSIRGMVPSPFERPSGCAFHPRCDEMIEGLCNVEAPLPVEVGRDHYVRCMRYVV
jgi:peptide/nickel transport system ATP-binding protein